MTLKKKLTSVVIIAFLFGVLLTTACGRFVKTTNSTIDTNTNEIAYLERIDNNELLKEGCCVVCLNVVGDGIDYFLSYKRMSKSSITNAEIAWKQVKSLYPDLASRIKCWTEYKGYYVFSIGYNDPKTDCMFFQILYVKKGGREFRYFWPHT